MYPVVDKRKSALLTKSIPFFWGVTNVVFKGDTGKRIEIIQKAYDAVPERFRSGDILATDVFISCAKPKSIDRAAAAGATTGPLHSYMPNSRPRGEMSKHWNPADTIRFSSAAPLANERLGKW